MYLLPFVGILFGLATRSILGTPYPRSNDCGYKTCNLGKEGKLNIHLVPHTHDDVGWLKTVDQYFYGARPEIRKNGVQYVIDSVIDSLLDNPDRRFIYVEMAFFWRWWMQQTPEKQNQVKQLVNEGRLEFISGGWCMHDEAATHYNSIIDQHSLGAEFLREEFGECGRAKIGWQIDPFGHSRESASLFAQMGFDGLFLGRADYQDIANRKAEKTQEMVWKASANLDRQSWLFTGILPNQYQAPPGFDFDYTARDPPIMDNPKLHDYNVPDRVRAFIQAAHDEAKYYATNQIIMTFGQDFNYEIADEWFKNIDKLLKYVDAQQENGSDVNVFYSTPSCYTYALNHANRTWPSKTDDFFPYALSPEKYWTGYFTSRPAFKRYERHANNILQMARQVNAFAQLNLRSNLFALTEPMGIVQHHDAISGTERQHVADDYIQRVAEGVDAAVTVITSAYGKLLSKTDQFFPAPTQYLCQLSNISECLPIEKQNQFVLTIWNPTVHPVNTYVRVPVTNDYLVTNPSGHTIVTELLPIPSVVLNTPGRTSTAQKQILFQASLPPLGFNSYYFQMKTSKEKGSEHLKVTHNEQCTLQNQFVRVEFDGEGNLLQLTNLQKNISVAFAHQGLYWYESYPNISGAYVFRPFTSTAQPVSSSRNITCMKTNSVQSAWITFNNWASQEVNLYENSSTVEVEWTVGPIPIDDSIGKEVIVRYDTDIASASKYYTDANGREVLERTRDYRPTWHYSSSQNVSANYYPVNSRIWIKDQQKQFTLLTDRSNGGASIRDGSLEVMVHRRILTNDSITQSLAEPLNETAFGQGLVVRGKHLLVLDSPNSSAATHRPLAQQFFMQPVATYALTNLPYANYSANYRQTWSALNHTMPLNLHLLTLDQLAPKEYLVRVEHYFEKNEDVVYSEAIEVDLQELLCGLGEVSDVSEMVLGGNMALSQLNRLNWTTTENESSYWSPKDILDRVSLRDTKVTLNPMQIRTFQVTLQ